MTPHAQPTLPSHHIRPRRGWINDPNGMAFHNGRWHVFFQHNPEGAYHDRIHWGHVSSPDLSTWTEHPVAFGPQHGGPDRFGCWSGVFVPGLERPAVVYSGVVDDGFQSTVCLRWATDDDLDTWTDPVVVARTPDADVDVMRDPFVFTVDGHRWAILGARLPGDVPAVLLYDCADILAWNYVGIWLDGHDLLADGRPLVEAASADIWECPQLVHTDGVDVLVLSTQLHGALETVVAVTGRMDAHPATGAPRFSPRSASRLDGGDIYYAPQCLSVPDRSPFVLGWLRQDDLRGDATADVSELVAGCLSFPREITVSDDDRVLCRLHPAVQDLASGTVETVRSPEQHPLPRAGRVRLDGAGHVTGADGPVNFGGARCELWTDGEVLEVYRDGEAPMSTRQVGTSSWLLTAPDATAEITPISVTGA